MAVEFINGYLEYEIPSQISRAVQDTLKIPENRRKFEEWYKERYGRDYVWKIAVCTYNFDTEEMDIEIREETWDELERNEIVVCNNVKKNL